MVIIVNSGYGGSDGSENGDGDNDDSDNDDGDIGDGYSDNDDDDNDDSDSNSYNVNGSDSDSGSGSNVDSDCDNDSDGGSDSDNDTDSGFLARNCLHPRCTLLCLCCHSQFLLGLNHLPRRRRGVKSLAAAKRRHNDIFAQRRRCPS
ncbi:hypothetical protein KIN20_036937 [Parelaphostrongylus tenuis]|uniref:Uncharacterized protein n=1 Tax=Parelaphostrongylus tenuis TaxID=148309 RepID=A0AAD5RDE8_PARTN|nr:hypothetical protein KIN20_036937 [Parelaphostrongylus tenuis]